MASKRIMDANILNECCSIVLWVIYNQLSTCTLNYTVLNIIQKHIQSYSLGRFQIYLAAFKFGAKYRFSISANCSIKGFSSSSTFSENQASRISLLTSVDVARRLMTRTFASFHQRAPLAVFASPHNAALIPGT